MRLAAVDDDNFSARLLVQLLDVIEAEAGQAVFVLHHDDALGFVEKLDQLCAGVVHAGTYFLEG